MLNTYSPYPLGKCLGDNNIKIKYDLQIIISVFDGEKFNGDCLRSVISQKTKYNILISIVNDGLIDNTAHIIDNIIASYRGNIEFELITQENYRL